MAKLPMKQASKLAETMAKHGIPGSISMGKPKMPMDESEPYDSEEEPDGSEMEKVMDELADAILSKDKEAICKGLKDLVDCIKEEDQESDMGE